MISDGFVPWLKTLLMATLLLAAGLAFAFDLRNIDLNKLQGVVGKAVEASKDVSEPEEIRIGEDLASTLLGAAPLLDDPTVQRYVNQVGRWIATRTERPNLPWTFGVLDTNSVNAFAAPGGYVFVTRGSLRAMHNEAELAGVLAHEMGHVLQRHHLRAIQKQAQVGFMAELAETMAPRKRQQLVGKLVEAGKKLYARGLDREDEYEADRMGVVLATRGGYQPFGLPEVLTTIQAMGTDPNVMGLLLSTHPPTGERLSRLNQLMGSRFDAFRSRPQEAGRFQTILRRLQADTRDHPATLAFARTCFSDGNR